MVNLGPFELLVMIVVTVGLELLLASMANLFRERDSPVRLSLLVLLPISLFLLFLRIFAEWPALLGIAEKSTSDF